MSNISNFEAASTGAKTLWIGDVEAWMDEAYITSLFAGVKFTCLYLNRLLQYSQSNLFEIRSKEVLLVFLVTFNSLGYGFVEFPNHEIAKNVYMTLNGSPIPGTTRNFKLNWATHGNGGLK